MLITVESNKSTRISVIKPTGIIIKSMFLQGLFLQHLHKNVSNIVSLQQYLPASIQDNILGHLYKDFSTVVSLLSSLPTSLRSRFLQSSLLASLRNKFLGLSLLVSLRSEFLRPSLFAYLWNIFLWCLYRDISTEIFLHIPSKPETCLQLICEFIILSM